MHSWKIISLILVIWLSSCTEKDSLKISDTEIADMLSVVIKEYPNAKGKRLVVNPILSFENLDIKDWRELYSDFESPFSFIPNHALENVKGGLRTSKLSKKYCKNCRRLPSAESFNLLFLPFLTT